MLEDGQSKYAYIGETTEEIVPENGLLTFYRAAALLQISPV